LNRSGLNSPRSPDRPADRRVRLARPIDLTLDCQTALVFLRRISGSLSFYSNRPSRSSGRALHCVAFSTRMVTPSPASDHPATRPPSPASRRMFSNLPRPALRVKWPPDNHLDQPLLFEPSGGEASGTPAELAAPTPRCRGTSRVTYVTAACLLSQVPAALSSLAVSDVRQAPRPRVVDQSAPLPEGGRQL